MLSEPQFSTIPFWNPSFTTTSHLILLRTYNYTVFDILESDAISVGQQFYPSIYLDIKHII